MTLEPELTYPLFWTDVPAGGVNKKISATKEECRQLAERLGVVSFPHVQAHFTVTRWQGTGLKVVADISAQVVQNCVVSLEAVTSTLNEQTEWFFKPAARPGRTADPDTVLQIDPLGEDPADPLVDGSIDLGELLSEHLCLMIDPFVRSGSVEFEALYADIQKSSAPEATNISPFAVLKQLGKKT